MQKIQLNSHINIGMGKVASNNLTDVILNKSFKSTIKQ